ncbi:hypothetical protein [Sulfurimonas sp.]|uniref:hypothetical protein n=1 Tax=Sulfurimonas sp. TaxID=2022749 RepID=UPI002B49D0B3|nr:hypothetical protein [Sulfurimonas sp.]
MIKTLLLIFMAIFFTGCINKHGVSAKYYSECKEYYDLQGYYHKECGEDDIVTYKEIAESAGKVVDVWTEKKEKPKGNVW